MKTVFMMILIKSLQGLKCLIKLKVCISDLVVKVFTDR